MRDACLVAYRIQLMTITSDMLETCLFVQNYLPVGNRDKVWARSVSAIAHPCLAKGNW